MRWLLDRLGRKAQESKREVAHRMALRLVDVLDEARRCRAALARSMQETAAFRMPVDHGPMATLQSFGKVAAESRRGQLLEQKPHRVTSDATEQRLARACLNGVVLAYVTEHAVNYLTAHKRVVRAFPGWAADATGAP